MEGYMGYKVAIRRNSDGEIRLRDIDFDNWEDSDLYWWTEGNFGCDRNRHLEFERAGGHDPDWNDGECGDSAYSVLYALLPNGDTISIDGMTQA